MAQTTFSADGSLEIPAKPGHDYVVDADGAGLGGGTCEVQYESAAGNWNAFTGGEISSLPFAKGFTAPGPGFRVNLSGATGPDFTVRITRVPKT